MEALTCCSAFERAGTLVLAVVPTHPYCLHCPTSLTAIACLALRPLSRYLWP